MPQIGGRFTMLIEIHLKVEDRQTGEPNSQSVKFLGYSWPSSLACRAEKKRKIKSSSEHLKNSGGYWLSRNWLRRVRSTCLCAILTTPLHSLEYKHAAWRNRVWWVYYSFNSDSSWIRACNLGTSSNLASIYTKWMIRHCMVSRFKHLQRSFLLEELISFEHLI